jgi:hypothetical protein
MRGVSDWAKPEEERRRTEMRMPDARYRMPASDIRNLVSGIWDPESGIRHPSNILQNDLPMSVPVFISSNNLLQPPT